MLTFQYHGNMKFSTVSYTQLSMRHTERFTVLKCVCLFFFFFKLCVYKGDNRVSFSKH